MTLLQIVDKLQTIALSQPNVRTAGEGNIYDKMNTNPSVKYGVFFITQNTHIEYEESDRYGLTLFYVDRLEDDMESNRLRIQSHGKQVLGNIITMFCNEFNADFPEITYTPFTEKFVDMTAGVYANIIIDIYKDTLCEDGKSPVWEKVSVLQNKQVNLTENGTIMITADNGYDGLKSVEINANIVDEDCYERGLADGVESGITYQKSLLSSTALTENGTYTSENGFSAVTVNVHPDTTDLTVTVNGQYTPPSNFIGYSAVTVNVNSGDCNMQILNVSLETDSGQQVSASTFTVSYFGQEDVYTYNGEPQEVAVYPGIEYKITFGDYEHHITPYAIGGTSSWGNYTYITGVYKWQSACYVDPESVEFEVTGGSAEISIVADGAWTATSTGDWYVQSTTTGTGNGTISIAAIGNNTGNILQGYVNVEFYDGTTGQTFVSQKPIIYLEVDEQYILFEHSGSSYHLAVSSNTDYTITVPDWITYIYEDNLLKLTASDLGDSQGRHGYVVFTYDGYTKAIDVNQVNSDYVLLVTSAGTYTTEYVGSNEWSTTSTNENGQTYIGSNITGVPSQFSVPSLKALAIDIPTTYFDLGNCSFDGAHIDYLTLPKNTRFRGNVDSSCCNVTSIRVRMNCNIGGDIIVDNKNKIRGHSYFGFSKVESLELGPDVNNIGQFAFVDKITDYDTTIYNYYSKYSIWAKEIILYGKLKEWDYVIKRIGTDISRNSAIHTAFAGVGNIHVAESINMVQGGIRGTEYWLPNQVADVTVPSYIKEKFV